MTNQNSEDRGRRAIALLRVSTEAQGAPERMSLEAQRQAVERIVRGEGLDLVDTIELRHSGAHMLEEPRFLALLDHVKRRELYGVVVADADRLMRPENLSDYAIFAAFQDSETLLFTASGRRDFTLDRPMLVFGSEFANWEREAIRRRTQRAKEILRRQGRKPEGGGLPRGVAYEHKTGRWSYTEPGASEVRTAFELLLSGETRYAEIARQTGIPASTLPSLLRHPLYAGRYEVRYRYQNGEKVPRAPEDVLVHRVLDPPLIAADDFDHAQFLLQNRHRRSAPHPRGLDAPATYAGHLVCGQCGALLWLVESRKAGRVYWQYGCGGRRSGLCGAHQTRARQADAALDSIMPELLGNADALEEIVQACANAQRQPDPRRPRHEEALASLHARRRRAQHAYEEDLLSIDELRDDLAAIDRETQALKRQLREEAKEVEIDESVLRDLALTFTCWAFLPRVHQRAVLRDFGVRLVVGVRGPRRRRQLTVASVSLDTLQLEHQASRAPASGLGATGSGVAGR